MSKFFHCRGDCDFNRNGFCIVHRWDVSKESPICVVYRKTYPGTVFQKITASPEVLAPKFVYCLNSSSFRVIDSAGRLLAYENEIWGSTILPGSFWTEYEEAIAATVAKLKEVCDE